MTRELMPPNRIQLGLRTSIASFWLPVWTIAETAPDRINLGRRAVMETPITTSLLRYISGSRKGTHQLRSSRLNSSTMTLRKVWPSHDRCVHIHRSRNTRVRVIRTATAVLSAQLAEQVSGYRCLTRNAISFFTRGVYGG